MATRLNGLKFPEKDGANGQVITTDGDGNLVFRNIDEIPNINTASKVAELTDVTELNLVDGATLVYNTNNETYEIKPINIDNGTY